MAGVGIDHNRTGFAEDKMVCTTSATRRLFALQHAYSPVPPRPLRHESHTLDKYFEGIDFGSATETMKALVAEIIPGHLIPTLGFD